MSVTRVSAELRGLVRTRAGERCEYCLIPESLGFASHEIDHVIAEKHGGKTVPENLSYSCALCNRFKGSDLTSIDPVSKEIAPLFDPRTQIWAEHFVFTEGRIEGLTVGGRATARLLKFNEAQRVEERRQLLATGLLG